MNFCQNKAIEKFCSFVEKGCVNLNLCICNLIPFDGAKFEVEVHVTVAKLA